MRQRKNENNPLCAWLLSVLCVSPSLAHTHTSHRFHLTHRSALVDMYSTHGRP